MLLKRGDYVRIKLTSSFEHANEFFDKELSKEWIMIVKVMKNGSFILEGLPGTVTKNNIIDYIPKEQTEAIRVLFR